MTRKQITSILKGKHFAFTTDGWTSLANVGYVTCTAHFIDATTWKLHSIVLGLYEKDGTSKADDIVNYCESQLTSFDLSYPRAVAVVTETEATMISAGRLLVSRSLEQGGLVHTYWEHHKGTHVSTDSGTESHPGTGEKVPSQDSFPCRL